jgi:hypothetical protein
MPYTMALFCVFNSQLCLAQLLSFEMHDSIVMSGFTQTYGGGISCFDFNNDGWDDLTFADPYGDINIWQNDSGTFFLAHSIENFQDIKSINWVDIDNDSDPDLFTTAYPGFCHLYRNDGNWNFVDISEGLNLPAVSKNYFGSSCADFDKDGWVDIFICLYVLPVPNSDSNVLLRNMGNGTFQNVTEEVGLGSNTFSSFQSIWFDFNFDTWPDLYIANDKHHGNELYLNVNGVFEDYASALSANIELESMSNTISDYDNDGDWDIYITNSNSGNALLNFSMQSFEDVASALNVSCNSFCWGALWLDADNDMLDDLHVNSNMGEYGEPNFCFKQNSDHTFSENNLPNDMDPTFASATGDFNNDGLVDFVSYQEAPFQINFCKNTSESDSEERNNYLKCNVMGTLSHYNSFGTTLKYFINGSAYIKQYACGEQFLAQNSQHEILSMGENDFIDSLHIYWPSGWVDKHYQIAANQHVHFIEGETFEHSIYCNESPYLCSSNQSVMLYAVQGFNYSWQDSSSLDYFIATEPGVYWLIISNQFGLADTAYFEVFLHNPVSHEIDYQNPYCFNEASGSITAICNSSNCDALSFSWYNQQQELVSDSNVLQNAGAGSYQLTTTSPNGCIDINYYSLAQPNPIVLEYELVDIMCEDGYAQLSLDVISDYPLQNFITDIANLDSIEPGDYFITATDVHNCSASINITVNAPDTIVVLNNTPIACFGEAVQADLEIENVQEYSINWGEDNPNALQAGSYPIEVHYNQSCIKYTTIEVQQYDQLEIEYVIDFTQNSDSGSILLIPQGGLPPYQYYWSNGSTQNPLTNVAQGLYQCTVSDAANCWLYTEPIMLINSISEIKQSPIVISPNPCTNQFKMDCTASNNFLYIKNMQGQLVYSEFVHSGSAVVSTHHFVSGVYVIQYGAYNTILVKM